MPSFLSVCICHRTYSVLNSSRRFETTLSFRYSEADASASD